MTRIAVVLATFCALVWAFSPGSALAQETRDPLIDPSEGSVGSRFQIVGQSGWVAGEMITLELAYTPADPLAFAGPFAFERQITVLRDGTWSFPIVVNDALLGAPLPDQPGYIVVRARSSSRTATNAYVYTVNGSRPVGAEAIAPLGFGPGAPTPGGAITIALFAAGLGVLLAVSGWWRRREVSGSRQRPERLADCPDF